MSDLQFEDNQSASSAYRAKTGQQSNQRRPQVVYFLALVVVVVVVIAVFLAIRVTAPSHQPITQEQIYQK
ncbi:MAG: hypothetical protein PHF79_02020 [Candidatus Pacebacteria bacterium]|nr:hypothetical protein [Candidatus Paceibacterota bacterium]